MSHFYTKSVALSAAVLIIFLTSPFNLSASGKMSAEFGSMQECLASLKATTGQDLQIFTDKPHRVSGYLSNSRKSFTCERKETGSKGIYYYGYYAK